MEPANFTKRMTDDNKCETNSVTSSEQSYPSEKSGLLPMTHDDTVPKKERRLPLLTSGLLVVLLAIMGMMLVAVSKMYHYYRPARTLQQTELDLVEEYAAIAAESMILLNDASVDSIPAGCEATVLIHRHCEDLGGHVRYKDGTSHCSYLGFQRSLYLATLFGNETTGPDDYRWPLPSHLYGMWNKDGNNKRQYEILHPLSDKAGVPIQMIPFRNSAQVLRSIIFDLLARGEMCNQVIDVAWKHKYIRELAATLGCDQEKGCPGGNIYAYDDYDFDTIWELQFVYQPEALRAYPHNESLYQHQYKRLFEGWQVYGTATRENFDPLNFKKAYYKGGAMVGRDDWMGHPEHDDN